MNEHVGHMGEMRNRYILARKSQEKKPLWEIILKWILMKQGVKV
jgi:hypothetical protein